MSALAFQAHLPSARRDGHASGRSGNRAAPDYLVEGLSTRSPFATPFTFSKLQRHGSQLRRGMHGDVER